MKRTITILLLIFTVSTLFAVDFGYGLSLSGTSGLKDSSSANIFIKSDLYQRKIFLSSGISLGYDNSKSFGLNSINFDVAFNLIQFKDHIFKFFFENDTLYSPGVNLGLYLDRKYDIYFKLGFSLIQLHDSSFVYDFLTPAIIFDSSLKYRAWSVELFKLSVLY